MKQPSIIGKSAAFSGHRTIPEDKAETLQSQLIETIRDLHAKGYRTFFCGMAMGFDLMAAFSVIYVRQQYGLDVRLIACIPFIGQESRFSEDDKFRYNTLLQAADEKVVIARKYSKYSYLRRNDFMLAHSTTLIAYHDPSQSKGGTAYTIRKAIEMKKDVVNLF